MAVPGEKVTVAMLSRKDVNFVEVVVIYASSITP